MKLMFSFCFVFLFFNAKQGQVRAHQGASSASLLKATSDNIISEQISDGITEGEADRRTDFPNGPTDRTGSNDGRTDGTTDGTDEAFYGDDDDVS